MYSKTFLIGRLAADAELHNGSGGSVANARIITSDVWIDKQSGEKKEKTEGHRVVFFGNLADVMANYGKKGTLVFIEGTPQSSSYQKNGETRYSHEVRCKVMKLLSGAKENHTYDENTQGVSNAQGGGQAPQQQGGYQGGQAPQQQGGYQGGQAPQQQGGYQGGQAPQQQGGYQGGQAPQQQGGYQGGQAPQQQGGYQGGQAPRQQQGGFHQPGGFNN
jgi:single-strand DNA-binding protein